MYRIPGGCAEWNDGYGKQTAYTRWPGWNYPNSFDGKDFRTAVVGDIPDKVVVTVRCSPEDEFNPETGCALARARLLEKMYDYRYTVAARAMNRITFSAVLFNELLCTCNERAMNYEDEENAILDSLKKSN